jgi:hypothetical protein
VSAGIGTGLSLLALRSGSPILRALGAVAGLALLARAAAGHCAVKAAIMGERQPHFSDTQEAVEERAHPEALEEGFAPGGPTVSTSSTAQH